ncbi:1890_t:CDS:1, partial [Dentiscutata heterogama]
VIDIRKTTFSDVVVNYLQEKGFTVYNPIEASLDLELKLKLFYKDPEKYTLFFQYIILNYYKNQVEKLNKLTSFDYIILDRTYIDTKVFTIANIDNDDILTYLEEQRQKIFQINNVDKIFYIKSTTKTMFE